MPKPRKKAKKNNSISINFGDIQDSLIPAGEHDATIEHITVRETKDGSGLYLQVQYVLTGETNAGSKMWQVISLKESMFWNLKAQFVALGVDPKDPDFRLEYDEDLAPSDRDFALLTEPSFEGVDVVIKVVHGEYQGRAQANVEAILESEFTWGDEEDEEDEEWDEEDEELEDDEVEPLL
jgi:hypothetical protein